MPVRSQVDAPDQREGYDGEHGGMFANAVGGAGGGMRSMEGSAGFCETLKTHYVACHGGAMRPLSIGGQKKDISRF